MTMELLLLFEPFARGVCSKYATEALRRLSASVLEVRNWGLRAIIAVEGGKLNDVVNVLRPVTCISSAYVVYRYVNDRGLDSIVEACAEVAQRLFPGAELAIEVRRWDKSYPIRSNEMARAIAKALLAKGLSALRPDAENVILVGVEKEFAIVAYATGYMVRAFAKSSLPRQVMDKVVAVVERPYTDYEIMDLVQLSRALGFRLRLLKPRRAALEKVLKILGTKPPNVEVVESDEEALSGVEVAVALSMYAREDERRLLEVLRASKGRVIAFVVGNEREDVSMDLRAKCVAEVRLGPLTGFSMRSSNALAYALGLALPTLSGYL